MKSAQNLIQNNMQNQLRSLVAFTLLIAGASSFMIFPGCSNGETKQREIKGSLEIPEAELFDRIRGGLTGQHYTRVIVNG